MRTDIDLLQAWRAGDQRAGAELFERYYDPLHRFFANKTSTDPSDLIQETFEACVNKAERIEPDRFRGFVFGVAYNRLKKFYERARTDGERLDYGTISSADLSPGASTMLAKSAEQRVLLEALRRIPVEHQLVLEMFYWENCTSAEIAQVLGEPHGTIRTRIRRARTLLTEAMAEVTDDAALLSQTRSDLEGWAAKIREANVGAQ